MDAVPALREGHSTCGATAQRSILLARVRRGNLWHGCAKYVRARGRRRFPNPYDLGNEACEVLTLSEDSEWGAERRPLPFLQPAQGRQAPEA